MSFDPIDFLVAAMQVDATSGHEGPFARWLADRLGRLGYDARLLPLPGAGGSERLNVFARPKDAAASGPIVLFNTHLDTVPPHIPPSREPGRIAGRGSCDAKGQIVAQIDAGERLRAQGMDAFGLLFVVGEENDHAGARAVGEEGLEPLGLTEPPRLVVIGEPTCGRFVKAHKGNLKLTLRAIGKAAHSAYPERGESATEKLLDGLQAMRALAGTIPDSDDLGPTTWNIGVIGGGVAANVIPDDAAATVFVRTTGPSAALGERVREAVRATAKDGREPPVVSIDRAVDPQRFIVPEGVDEVGTIDVVGFGTDAPFLRPLGAPIALYGPGDIECAHGIDEHVPIDAIHESARVLARVAERALAGSAP